MIPYRQRSLTRTILLKRIDSLPLVIHLKDVCSLYHTRKEGMRYGLSTHVLQLYRRGKDMKTKTIEELRPEYEFDYSKAVRGKYFKRLIEEGANVAVLEPEVARVFTSSAAVNEALRSLLEITKSTQRLTKHSTGRAKKLRAG